jgi:SAM-dependent methyltransferase
MHDWESLAATWERGRALLWRSTRPVSERLVELLDPRPGETILELAAGVGETGFLAAERGAHLISTDRAPQMVEAAQRTAAALGIEGVEFRVFSSDRIELPDMSVDAVLCRFGYILLGDALREVARVLKPEGRLVFSAWRDRGASPWMAIPRDVLVERGHVPAREPDPPWSEQSIRALLEAAGFGSATVEEQDVAYRFADADELWLYVSELLGPVAAVVGRLDEAERRRIRALVEAAAPRSAGGYALPGRSLTIRTDLRQGGTE